MADTALVTGGAGFIGSHLVGRLLESGYDVVVIDDLSAGSASNLPPSDRLRFFKKDVRDGDLGIIYQEFRPTWVFHLAAHFANELSIREPREDLQVNILGTLAQLELARKVGVRRFVFASSSCVYALSNRPLRENDRLEPHTPYGITKLAAEHYCRFYSDYYGLPVTILRYFNVYGPRDPVGEFRNVIPRFISRASGRRPIPILGNGEDTRDYTYVGDAASATLHAALGESTRNEVLNIGTGRETTLLELVGLIRGLAGPVQVQFKQRRHWDSTRRRVACIGKARKLLGYRPTTSLAEGLALTWEWYRTHCPPGPAADETEPGAISGHPLEEGTC